MKKKRQILCILALVALLVGVFGTAAFAASEDGRVADGTPALTAGEGGMSADGTAALTAGDGGMSADGSAATTTEGNSTLTTDVPGGVGGTEDTTADNAEDGTGKKEAADTDESTSGGTNGTEGTTATDNGEGNEASGNIFDELFALAMEYSGEIFSCLSLAASLLLAYLYRSGLSPLIKNALAGLSDTVHAIRESVKESEEKGGSVTAALGERLMAAEAVITKLSESIDTMTASLAAKESEEGERAEFKTVLAAQIDMLYEIFMTSNLPQYKKDAVGERIAEMRRSVGIDEKQSS